MDEPAAGDSVAALAPDDILDLTALGERYGASPALRWHGLTVSYRAYVRRAARIAAALAEAGVRPNQRIALPAELDPPTWATTLFAILATGAVAVLLPARAAARERDRLLAQTCAIERQGAPAQGAPAPAPVRISIHRPATVVFTSGSSGAAKAVLHSTANHLYNAAGSSANIPLGPDDAWLVALPLSHVAGLSILFRTLSAGACALFAESGAFHDADDPAARLLPAATHVSLVETQLRRLLQIPGWQALTGRLRAALIGGSALSGPLLRQARDQGLPVCASYGCTEMASQVATTRPGDPDETFTAARVLPHRKAAIDADGEILLGGHTLCLGYLEREHVRPAAGASGWFASGDLGRLDGGKAVRHRAPRRALHLRRREHPAGRGGAGAAGTPRGARGGVRGRAGPGVRQPPGGVSGPRIGSAAPRGHGASSRSPARPLQASGALLRPSGDTLRYRRQCSRRRHQVLPQYPRRPCSSSHHRVRLKPHHAVYPVLVVIPCRGTHQPFPR